MSLTGSSDFVKKECCKVSMAQPSISKSEFFALCTAPNTNELLTGN